MSPPSPVRIAPSVLAADLADLAGAVATCEAVEADLVHVDVMDGHFVPNLSFGIPVLAALAERTELPLDVHLMVSNPGRLLDDYAAAGADRIAVHQEASVHLHRLLDRIRDLGKDAGVAINPATPVETLVDCLDATDFVVVMSVDPGFGGQSFLPRSLDKVRRLRRLIAERELEVEIEIDGGVNRGTIASVVEAGVDTCVVGSATFRGDDPRANVDELRRLAAAAAP